MLFQIKGQKPSQAILAQSTGCGVGCHMAVCREDDDCGELPFRSGVPMTSRIGPAW